MRATGKDGFLYSIKFGEPIVGGSEIKIETPGFYRIKSKASGVSGIPSKNPLDTDAVDLAVDMIYWAKKDQPLNEGDTVVPLVLTKISFVTDTSDSSQSTSHDVTTQADVDTGLRAYVPGAFKERTGSINGYVDTGSEEQRELLKEYRMVEVDDGTNISVFKSKTSVHHYMLSRAENVPEGDFEMWEYFPVITEQLQMDKPMDGTQPFNFNYRVDGSSKPMTIFKQKEAV